MRELLERELEVVRRLEAILAALLETARHDGGDGRRDVQSNLWWIVSKDGEHCLRRGVALKGPPASEHLVGYRPERENICSVVHRLAADLLRRHVAGGAENDARRGVPLVKIRHVVIHALPGVLG